MAKIAVLLIAGWIAYAVSESLIAYDCSQPKLNITSISLVSTPACIDDNSNITTTTERVTITQNSLYREINYIRCSIVTNNLVTRCGKTIDTMQQGGLYSEILRVGRDECAELVAKGRYRFTGGNGYTDIEVTEGYTKVSLVTRGSISSGSCEPGPAFVKNGYHYERPVVNTEVEIKISKGLGFVDLEENAIKIEGKKFDLKAKKGFDADLGHVFWDIPLPDCTGESPKSVVFEGMAELVVDNNGERFIQVTHSGYDFQILLDNKTRYICGLLSWETEHPKLYVTFLGRNQPSLNIQHTVQSTEVSMLNYINSKIVYAFRHMREDVMALYKLFKQDRCKTNNRITENLMTLALTSPKEFAYAYGGQGFTAVTRGEVVYIAQCSPVVVQPDLNREGCFNELPVIHRNKTAYITPRSRILVPVGTPVECLPNMLPKFNLFSGWYYASTHGVIKSESPNIIAPEPISFEFHEVSGLTSGGLYSDRTMEKYQKAVISPVVNDIITARMVTSVEGGSKLPDGYSIANALNPQDFDVIGNKIGTWWDRFSQGAQKTGSWFGFTIMTFAVYKFVVYFLSCLINFRELRKEVGMFWAIPLCLIETVANLVFRGKIFKRESDVEKAEPMELVSKSPMVTIYRPCAPAEV